MYQFIWAEKLQGAKTEAKETGFLQGMDANRKEMMREWIGVAGWVKSDTALRMPFCLVRTIIMFHTQNTQTAEINQYTGRNQKRTEIITNEHGPH